MTTLKTASSNSLLSYKFRSRIGLYLMLFFVTFIFMVPILWLILNSFKPNAEYGTYPIQFIPSTWMWENYVDALTKTEFVKYAGNSLVLGLLFTIPNVIVSAFVGYGFARLRAPGRNLLFIVLLATMMIPQVVTVIPQFVFYARLKLVGTYWPWLLWGLGGSAPQIFLFRQFFSAFPRELEDAAAIDGCNPVRTFWKIFLPNSGPVLAATAIFAFMWVWGDYFNPALLLNADNTTLAVAMGTAFNDPRGNPLYTLTMAGNVLYILPLVVVYFFAQKQIVKGIVTTGFK
jgi:multiple sugar transport system permease protein